MPIASPTSFGCGLAQTAAIARVAVPQGPHKSHDAEPCALLKEPAAEDGLRAHDRHVIAAFRSAHCHCGSPTTVPNGETRSSTDRTFGRARRGPKLEIGRHDGIRTLIIFGGCEGIVLADNREAWTAAVNLVAR
jgi:hypothetical protein